MTKISESRTTILQNKGYQPRYIGIVTSFLLMFSVFLLVPAKNVLAEAGIWVDVSDQFQVKTSRPYTSRRSRNAFIIVEVRNTSEVPMNAPLRLVLENIRPSSVSVLSADGERSGEPYVDLTSYMREVLLPGASSTRFRIVLSAKRLRSFSFTPVIEQHRELLVRNYMH